MSESTCRPERRPALARRSTTTAPTPVLIAAFWLIASALVPAYGVPADNAIQTDWSGAPSAGGPVSRWGSAFGASQGISWLAVPGQITLSGVVREEAEKNVLAENFEGPASLDVADLDGDGDLDIVGAAIRGHEIRWWRNEGGDPPIWAIFAIDENFTGASSVHSRDVDGDGTIDVVGCAWDGGEVAVWYNGGQGGAWAKQTVSTDFAAAHWVDTADVDGDGDVDLLGAAADSHTVAWWRNDGGQPIAWALQSIDTAFGGARSSVPADLDGDGRVDVLGTALLDDEVSWWRNEGGEPVAWTRNLISDRVGGAHHAGAWDIDLDGDLDIIAAGYGSAWLTLWRNDGAHPASWVEEPFGAPILGALVVDVADLDGDGDLDVIASSDRWDRVMWWQNTGGTPTNWPALVIDDGLANAWPLIAADLDEDGAVDVISGASGAAEVAWWRVTDFVEAGSIESQVLATPDDVGTLECAIDAVTPPGTTVEVEFRIGEHADDLGDWRSIVPNRQLPVLVRGPAHLQYRVIMSSTVPTVAPILREIAFEWTTELVSPPPRRSGGRVSP